MFSEYFTDPDRNSSCNSSELFKEDFEEKRFRNSFILS